MQYNYFDICQHVIRLSYAYFFIKSVETILVIQEFQIILVGSSHISHDPEWPFENVSSFFFLHQVNWHFLFFSWDRPVTKNQVRNTKCQLKFLLFIYFQIETTTKNFSWHLVFGIWFSVFSRTNEKNIYYIFGENIQKGLVKPTRYILHQ